MKDFSTISLRKELKEQLHRLAEQSERGFVEWDIFFRDIIDYFVKKYKLEGVKDD